MHCLSWDLRGRALVVPLPGLECFETLLTQFWLRVRITEFNLSVVDSFKNSRPPAELSISFCARVKYTTTRCLTSPSLVPVVCKVYCRSRSSWYTTHFLGILPKAPSPVFAPVLSRNLLIAYHQLLTIRYYWIQKLQDLSFHWSVAPKFLGFSSGRCQASYPYPLSSTPNPHSTYGRSYCWSISFIYPALSLPYFPFPRFAVFHSEFPVPSILLRLQHSRVILRGARNTVYTRGTQSSEF